MKYAGLTDDPEKTKKENSRPLDFKVRQFGSESEARRWEKHMRGQGYKNDKGSSGWRYGYTFSD